MGRKRAAKKKPEQLGKKPSGAAYRKLRKERAAQERVETAHGKSALEELLAKIGEAPLGDADVSMPWFRRAQIVLLGELLKDPDVSIREKFTAVKQMSEAAGKTRDPASHEARLVAVEAQLAGSRSKGAVEVKGTHGLPRPPTARGGSRARRPRPVEGPPARPDKP